MKIENNNLNPLAPKSTGGVERTESTARGKSAGNVARVDGRDKAEVSENARLLSKARTSLENVNDVESERVQSLRQQVESGNYKVQVEDIARKLVRLFR